MDLTKITIAQLDELRMRLQATLPLCNEDKLAEIFHIARCSVEELEQLLQESAEYVTAKQTIKAIEDILTQRLHDSGSTSFNTPHGTIHTVSKTTAKIMDPESLWAFVHANNRRDLLDLKANMTSCRDHMQETKEPVPGVELSTYRRLSITAPKIQMKRLINE